MKTVGVYIHIPFCKSKCYYCDFVSFANKDNKVDKYISLLKQEIKESEVYKAKTIYIGGGTPSYIDTKYIKEIMALLHYESNAEITIEVNPGTVDEQKLKDYYNMGINRLSIGLQSTNNEVLQEIGRIHKYEDFLHTYNMARKIGFKNINVDIIIGLPEQTLYMVEDTVNDVLGLNPEHISVYSLIVEEGTKLEHLIRIGNMKLPSDDVERAMYWKTKRMLENAGYVHYEISNFARIGYTSRHNMDCWNQEEYIGYGLGAHSYIDNVRFCNTANMEDYMKCDRIVNEVQTEYSKMQEFVMLGLRKIQGVNIHEFRNKFVRDLCEVFKNELSKLYNLELIEEAGDYIRLSEKGIDLANIVWKEFI